MKSYQVRDRAHLDQLIEDGHTAFAIALRGGVYSRKTITKTRTGYRITNHIDDSTQTLADLFDEHVTNIGKALAVGALYALDDTI